MNIKGIMSLLFCFLLLSTPFASAQALAPDNHIQEIPPQDTRLADLAVELHPDGDAIAVPMPVVLQKNIPLPTLIRFIEDRAAMDPSEQLEDWLENANLQLYSAEITIIMTWLNHLLERLMNGEDVLDEILIYTAQLRNLDPNSEELQQQADEIEAYAQAITLMMQASPLISRLQELLDLMSSSDYVNSDEFAGGVSELLSILASLKQINDQLSRLPGSPMQVISQESLDSIYQMLAPFSSLGDESLVHSQALLNEFFQLLPTDSTVSLETTQMLFDLAIEILDDPNLQDQHEQVFQIMPILDSWLEQHAIAGDVITRTPDDLDTFTNIGSELSTAFDDLIQQQVEIGKQVDEEIPERRPIVNFGKLASLLPREGDTTTLENVRKMRRMLRTAFENPYYSHVKHLVNPTYTSLQNTAVRYFQQPAESKIKLKSETIANIRKLAGLPPEQQVAAVPQPAIQSLNRDVEKSKEVVEENIEDSAERLDDRNTEFELKSLELNAKRDYSAKCSVLSALSLAATVIPLASVESLEATQCKAGDAFKKFQVSLFPFQILGPSETGITGMIPIKISGKSSYPTVTKIVGTKLPDTDNDGTIDILDEDKNDPNVPGKGPEFVDNPTYKRSLNAPIMIEPGKLVPASVEPLTPAQPAPIRPVRPIIPEAPVPTTPALQEVPTFELPVVTPEKPTIQEVPEFRLPVETPVLEKGPDELETPSVVPHLTESPIFGLPVEVPTELTPMKTVGPEPFYVELAEPLTEFEIAVEQPVLGKIQLGTLIDFTETVTPDFITAVIAEPTPEFLEADIDNTPQIVVPGGELGTNIELVDPLPNDKVMITVDATDGTTDPPSPTVPTEPGPDWGLVYTTQWLLEIDERAAEIDDQLKEQCDQPTQGIRSSPGILPGPYIPGIEVSAYPPEFLDAFDEFVSTLHGRVEQQRANLNGIFDHFSEEKAVIKPPVDPKSKDKKEERALENFNKKLEDSKKHREKANELTKKASEARDPAEKQKLLDEAKDLLETAGKEEKVAYEIIAEGSPQYRELQKAIKESEETEKDLERQVSEDQERKKNALDRLKQPDLGLQELKNNLKRAESELRQIKKQIGSRKRSLAEAKKKEDNDKIAALRVELYTLEMAKTELNKEIKHYKKEIKDIEKDPEKERKSLENSVKYANNRIDRKNSDAEYERKRQQKLEANRKEVKNKAIQDQKRFDKANEARKNKQLFLLSVNDLLAKNKILYYEVPNDADARGDQHDELRHPKIIKQTIEYLDPSTCEDKIKDLEDRIKKSEQLKKEQEDPEALADSAEELKDSVSLLKKNAKKTHEEKKREESKIQAERKRILDQIGRTQDDPEKKKELDAEYTKLGKELIETQDKADDAKDEAENYQNLQDNIEALQKEAQDLGNQMAGASEKEKKELQQNSKALADRMHMAEQKFGEADPKKEKYADARQKVDSVEEKIKGLKKEIGELEEEGFTEEDEDLKEIKDTLKEKEKEHKKLEAKANSLEREQRTSKDLEQLDRLKEDLKKLKEDPEACEGNPLSMFVSQLSYLQADFLFLQQAGHGTGEMSEASDDLFALFKIYADVSFENLMQIEGKVHRLQYSLPYIQEHKTKISSALDEHEKLVLKKDEAYALVRKAKSQKEKERRMRQFEDWEAQLESAQIQSATSLFATAKNDAKTVFKNSIAALSSINKGGFEKRVGTLKQQSNKFLPALDEDLLKWVQDLEDNVDIVQELASDDHGLHRWRVRFGEVNAEIVLDDEKEIKKLKKAEEFYLEQLEKAHENYIEFKKYENDFIFAVIELESIAKEFENLQSDKDKILEMKDNYNWETATPAQFNEIESIAFRYMYLLDQFSSQYYRSLTTFTEASFYAALTSAYITQGLMGFAVEHADNLHQAPNIKVVTYPCIEVSTGQPKAEDFSCNACPVASAQKKLVRVAKKYNIPLEEIIVKAVASDPKSLQKELHDAGLKRNEINEVLDALNVFKNPRKLSPEDKRRRITMLEGIVMDICNREGASVYCKQLIKNQFFDTQRLVIKVQEISNKRQLELGNAGKNPKDIAKAYRNAAKKLEELIPTTAYKAVLNNQIKASKSEAKYWNTVGELIEVEKGMEWAFNNVEKYGAGKNPEYKDELESTKKRLIELEKTLGETAKNIDQEHESVQEKLKAFYTNVKSQLETINRIESLSEGLKKFYDAASGLEEPTDPAAAAKNAENALDYLRAEAVNLEEEFAEYRRQVAAGETPRDLNKEENLAYFSNRYKLAILDLLSRVKSEIIDGEELNIPRSFDESLEFWHSTFNAAKEELAELKKKAELLPQQIYEHRRQRSALEDMEYATPEEENARIQALDQVSREIISLEEQVIATDFQLKQEGMVETISNSLETYASAGVKKWAYERLQDYKRDSEGNFKALTAADIESIQKELGAYLQTYPKEIRAKLWETYNKLPLEANVFQLSTRLFEINASIDSWDRLSEEGRRELLDKIDTLVQMGIEAVDKNHRDKLFSILKSTKNQQMVGEISSVINSIADVTGSLKDKQRLVETRAKLTVGKTKSALDTKLLVKQLLTQLEEYDTRPLMSRLKELERIITEKGGIGTEQEEKEYYATRKKIREMSDAGSLDIYTLLYAFAHGADSHYLMDEYRDKLVDYRLKTGGSELYNDLWTEIDKKVIKSAKELTGYVKEVDWRKFRLSISDQIIKKQSYDELDSEPYEERRKRMLTPVNGLMRKTALIKKEMKRLFDLLNNVEKWTDKVIDGKNTRVKNDQFRKIEAAITMLLNEKKALDEHVRINRIFLEVSEPSLRESFKDDDPKIVNPIIDKSLQPIQKLVESYRDLESFIRKMERKLNEPDVSEAALTAKIKSIPPSKLLELYRKGGLDSLLDEMVLNNEEHTFVWEAKNRLNEDYGKLAELQNKYTGFIETALAKLIVLDALRRNDDLVEDFLDSIDEDNPFGDREDIDSEDSLLKTLREVIRGEIKGFSKKDLEEMLKLYEPNEYGADKAWQKQKRILFEAERRHSLASTELTDVGRTLYGKDAATNIALNAIQSKVNRLSQIIDAELTEPDELSMDNLQKISQNYLEQLDRMMNDVSPELKEIVREEGIARLDALAESLRSRYEKSFTNGWEERAEKLRGMFKQFSKRIASKNIEAIQINAYTHNAVTDPEKKSENFKKTVSHLSAALKKFTSTLNEESSERTLNEKRMLYEGIIGQWFGDVTDFERVYKEIRKIDDLVYALDRLKRHKSYRSYMADKFISDEEKEIINKLGIFDKKGNFILEKLNKVVSSIEQANQVVEDDLRAGTMELIFGSTVFSAEFWLIEAPQIFIGGMAAAKVAELGLKVVDWAIKAERIAKLIAKARSVSIIGELVDPAIIAARWAFGVVLESGTFELVTERDWPTLHTLPMFAGLKVVSAPFQVATEMKGVARALSRWKNLESTYAVAQKPWALLDFGDKLRVIAFHAAKDVSEIGWFMIIGYDSNMNFGQNLAQHTLTIYGFRMGGKMNAGMLHRITRPKTTQINVNKIINNIKKTNPLLYRGLQSSVRTHGWQGIQNLVAIHGRPPSHSATGTARGGHANVLGKGGKAGVMDWNLRNVKNELVKNGMSEPQVDAMLSIISKHFTGAKGKALREALGDPAKLNKLLSGDINSLSAGEKILAKSLRDIFSHGPENAQGLLELMRAYEAYKTSHPSKRKAFEAERDLYIQELAETLKKDLVQGPQESNAEFNARAKEMAQRLYENPTLNLNDALVENTKRKEASRKGLDDTSLSKLYEQWKALDPTSESAKELRAELERQMKDSGVPEGEIKGVFETGLAFNNARNWENFRNSKELVKERLEQAKKEGDKKQAEALEETLRDMEQWESDPLLREQFSKNTHSTEQNAIDFLKKLGIDAEMSQFYRNKNGRGEGGDHLNVVMDPATGNTMILYLDFSGHGPKANHAKNTLLFLAAKRGIKYEGNMKEYLQKLESFAIETGIFKGGTFATVNAYEITSDGLIRTFTNGSPDIIVKNGKVVDTPKGSLFGYSEKLKINFKEQILEHKINEIDNIGAFSDGFFEKIIVIEGKKEVPVQKNEKAVEQKLRTEKPKSLKELRDVTEGKVGDDVVAILLTRENLQTLAEFGRQVKIRAEAEAKKVPKVEAPARIAAKRVPGVTAPTTKFVSQDKTISLEKLPKNDPQRIKAEREIKEFERKIKASQKRLAKARAKDNTAEVERLTKEIKRFKDNIDSRKTDKYRQTKTFKELTNVEEIIEGDTVLALMDINTGTIWLNTEIPNAAKRIKDLIVVLNHESSHLLIDNIFRNNLAEWRKLVNKFRGNNRIVEELSNPESDFFIGNKNFEPSKERVDELIKRDPNLSREEAAMILREYAAITELISHHAEFMRIETDTGLVLKGKQVTKSGLKGDLARQLSHILEGVQKDVDLSSIFTSKADWNRFVEMTRQRSAWNEYQREVNKRYREAKEAYDKGEGGPPSMDKIRSEVLTELGVSESAIRDWKKASLEENGKVLVETMKDTVDSVKNAEAKAKERVFESPWAALKDAKAAEGAEGAMRSRAKGEVGKKGRHFSRVNAEQTIRREKAQEQELRDKLTTVHNLVQRLLLKGPRDPELQTFMQRVFGKFANEATRDSAQADVKKLTPEQVKEQLNQINKAIESIKNYDYARYKERFGRFEEQQMTDEQLGGLFREQLKGYKELLLERIHREWDADLKRPRDKRKISDKLKIELVTEPLGKTLAEFEARADTLEYELVNRYVKEAIGKEWDVSLVDQILDTAKYRGKTRLDVIKDLSALKGTESLEKLRQAAKDKQKPAVLFMKKRVKPKPEKPVPAKEVPVTRLPRTKTSYEGLAEKMGKTEAEAREAVKDAQRRQSTTEERMRENDVALIFDPAAQVEGIPIGGDVVEMIVLPDGRIHIGITDYAGHGIKGYKARQQVEAAAGKDYTRTFREKPGLTVRITKADIEARRANAGKYPAVTWLEYNPKTGEITLRHNSQRLVDRLKEIEAGKEPVAAEAGVKSILVVKPNGDVRLVKVTGKTLREEGRQKIEGLEAGDKVFLMNDALEGRPVRGLERELKESKELTGTVNEVVEKLGERIKEKLIEEGLGRDDLTVVGFEYKKPTEAPKKPDVLFMKKRVAPKPEKPVPAKEPTILTLKDLQIMPDSAIISLPDKQLDKLRTEELEYVTKRASEIASKSEKKWENAKEELGKLFELTETAPDEMGIIDLIEVLRSDVRFDELLAKRKNIDQANKEVYEATKVQVSADLRLGMIKVKQPPKAEAPAEPATHIDIVTAKGMAESLARGTQPPDFLRDIAETLGVKMNKLKEAAKTDPAVQNEIRAIAELLANGVARDKVNMNDFVRANIPREIALEAIKKAFGDWQPSNVEGSTAFNKVRSEQQRRAVLFMKKRVKPKPEKPVPAKEVPFEQEIKNERISFLRGQIAYAESRLKELKISQETIQKYLKNFRKYQKPGSKLLPLEQILALRHYRLANEALRLETTEITQPAEKIVEVPEGSRIRLESIRGTIREVELLGITVDGDLTIRLPDGSITTYTRESLRRFELVRPGYEAREIKAVEPGTRLRLTSKRGNTREVEFHGFDEAGNLRIRQTGKTELDTYFIGSLASFEIVRKPFLPANRVYEVLPGSRIRVESVRGNIREVIFHGFNEAGDLMITFKGKQTTYFRDSLQSFEIVEEPGLPAERVGELQPGSKIRLISVRNNVREVNFLGFNEKGELKIELPDGTVTTYKKEALKRFEILEDVKVNERIVQENVNRLRSKEYNWMSASESISGNAGRNKAAINAFVDKNTGEIKAIGNIQHIPESIKNNPNNADVTFVENALNGAIVELKDWKGELTPTARQTLEKAIKQRNELESPEAILEESNLARRTAQEQSKRKDVLFMKKRVKPKPEKPVPAKEAPALELLSTIKTSEGPVKASLGKDGNIMLESPTDPRTPAEQWRAQEEMRMRSADVDSVWFIGRDTELDVFVLRTPTSRFYIKFGPRMTFVSEAVREKGKVKLKQVDRDTEQTVLDALKRYIESGRNIMASSKTKFSAKNEFLKNPENVRLNQAGLLEWKLSFWKSLLNRMKKLLRIPFKESDAYTITRIDPGKSNLQKLVAVAEKSSERMEQEIARDPVLSYLYNKYGLAIKDSLRLYLLNKGLTVYLSENTGAAYSNYLRTILHPESEAINKMDFTHELTHHIWKKSLTPEQKKAWKRYIMTERPDILERISEHPTYKANPEKWYEEALAYTLGSMSGGEGWLKTGNQMIAKDYEAIHNLGIFPKQMMRELIMRQIEVLPKVNEIKNPEVQQWFREATESRKLSKEAELVNNIDNPQKTTFEFREVFGDNIPLTAINKELGVDYSKLSESERKHAVARYIKRLFDKYSNDELTDKFVGDRVIRGFTTDQWNRMSIYERMKAIDSEQAKIKEIGSIEEYQKIPESRPEEPVKEIPKAEVPAKPSEEAPTAEAEFTPPPAWVEAAKSASKALGLAFAMTCSGLMGCAGQPVSSTELQLKYGMTSEEVAHYEDADDDEKLKALFFDSNGLARTAVPIEAFENINVLAMLNHPDEVVRMAALRASTRVLIKNKDKNRAINIALGKLKDKSVQVRISALNSLARLKYVEPKNSDNLEWQIFSRVSELLQDPSIDVKSDVASFIAYSDVNIMTRPYNFEDIRKKATPPILELLRSENTRNIQHAALAAEKLAIKEAIPIMTKLLENPDRDLKRAIVESLSKLADWNAIKNHIPLNHIDPEVRMDAIKLSSLFNQKEIVRKALKDSNPEVRKRAASLLSKEDIPPLMKELNSPDPFTRAWAIEILGWAYKYGSVYEMEVSSFERLKRISESILETKNDKSEQVKISAIKALRSILEIGYPDVVIQKKASEFMQTMLKDKSSVRAAAAREYGGTIAKLVQFKEIIPLLNDQNEEVQIAAVKALDYHLSIEVVYEKDVPDIKILYVLLKHKSPEMRKNAVVALTSYAAIIGVNEEKRQKAKQAIYDAWKTEQDPDVQFAMAKGMYPVIAQFSEVWRELSEPPSSKDRTAIYPSTNAILAFKSLTLEDVERIQKTIDKLRAKGESVDLLKDLPLLVSVPAESLNREKLVQSINALLQNKKLVKREVGIFLVPQTWNENKDKLSVIDLYRIELLLKSMNVLRNDIGKLIEEDLRDKSTEHGGLIIEENGAAKVIRYEAKCIGDNCAFASSEEMKRDLITPEKRALGDWHGHAVSLDSSLFAGPSISDLRVVKHFHSPKFVFTTLGRDDQGRLIFNIDYFTVTGKRTFTVDLGVYTFMGKPLKEVASLPKQQISGRFVSSLIAEQPLYAKI